MKLRLDKNSVRLRVLRSEVQTLQSGTRLKVTLCFGMDEAAQFTYSLQGAADITSTTVTFKNGAIAVQVPKHQLLQWASSEDVGIYSQVETGGGNSINVLVEKDFACLDRNDAENSDTFHNPKANC